MKDKLNYIMSFVGKRIVLSAGWFDYCTGTIKSVEIIGNQYDYKVKFVIDNIILHCHSKTLELKHTPTVLLEHYLNYHHQRWGMWALADSKAGKDLVHRIERTWDRKPKPCKNPYNVPDYLNEINKKYFNLVKEHQKAGLPIWIRTKYRAADTEYKLVKAEADEYKLTIQNEKAFIECWRASYAQKVKVTNLGRKYFFTKEEGLNSLK